MAITGPGSQNWELEKPGEEPDIHKGGYFNFFNPTSKGTVVNTVPKASGIQPCRLYMWRVERHGDGTLRYDHLI